MPTMQGMIAGPVVVDRDLDIDGTIVGDAIVRPSTTLHLRGVITGDLTIEKGATAIIYGMVDGRIRKSGGTVVIVHPEPRGE
jgi:cytoskeletal protein CcmA (bactofilin family)